MKKVILVTGATGAIGQAIVKELQQEPGWRIYAIGRKIEKLSGLLKSCHCDSELLLIRKDISTFHQIETLLDEIQEPLDILLNGAACAPLVREVSSEGIELQWALNVLSYGWMFQVLKSRLDRGKSKRIINIASYWAGGLDLFDPEFCKRPYSNDKAYRASKEANRLLTKGFYDRYKNEGYSFYACHPGDVSSKLSQDLGCGGWESPLDGARTPLMLIRETLEERVAYYEGRVRRSCPFMNDQKRVENLLRVFDEYSKQE